MADYVGTTEAGADLARQQDITGRPLIFGNGTPTGTAEEGWLYCRVDSSPVSLELWQYVDSVWTATGLSLLYYPVPTGGTTGQVLAKNSADDFDLVWTSAGGGASVGSTVPDAITPDQSGAAGSSSEAARADHSHQIDAAAPSANLTPSTTNAEGAANSFARSDHSHAVTTGAPTTNLTPSSTNAEGSAASFARSDHSHAITTAAPSSNLTASTTNAAGTAASFARSDHSHAITTGSAATISGSNAAGTSASLARADHDHALASGVVGTAQIATGAVTAAKLAAQTIDTKSDSYTLVASDEGKVIAMNKATAQTVTVNSSLGLSTGQRIDILQTGAGQVTVSASSVTLNGTPGLKLRAQYSAATLLCVGSNSYILLGDLAA